MHDVPGDRVSLVSPQGHRLALVEVDQQLSLEHQEELILVEVLVPVKVALDHSEPDHHVVDARQGLVEPPLAGALDLGGKVDQVGLNVLVVQVKL
jgi:hypothetical protein